jgi:hypothetical protein
MNNQTTPNQTPAGLKVKTRLKAGPSGSGVGKVS